MACNAFRHGSEEYVLDATPPLRSDHHEIDRRIITRLLRDRMPGYAQKHLRLVCRSTKTLCLLL
jgi:hypothetical protein